MDYILKINKLIKLKKITQSELSQKLGKTKNTVNNWLQCHTKLDVDSMLSIAEALGVHPCVFFKEDITDAQITAIGKDNAVLNGNGNAIIYGEPPNRKAAQQNRINILLADCEKIKLENEYLKQQIADKNEIINLLKGKRKG